MNDDYSRDEFERDRFGETGDDLRERKTDWTPIGEIKHGVELPEPAIGDVYGDKANKYRLAWITDTLPFTPKDEKPKPIERVCIEFEGGSRAWMSVADLRKRFAFKRRAT